MINVTQELFCKWFNIEDAEDQDQDDLVNAKMSSINSSMSPLAPCCFQIYIIPRIHIICWLMLPRRSLQLYTTSSINSMKLPNCHVFQDYLQISTGSFQTLRITKLALMDIYTIEPQLATSDTVSNFNGVQKLKNLIRKKFKNQTPTLSLVSTVRNETHVPLND